VLVLGRMDVAGCLQGRIHVTFSTDLRFMWANCVGCVHDGQCAVLEMVKAFGDKPTGRWAPEFFRTISGGCKMFAAEPIAMEIEALLHKIGERGRRDGTEYVAVFHPRGPNRIVPAEDVPAAKAIASSLVPGSPARLAAQLDNGG